MARHIPSTRSLLVFQAAARHQSVSKAAEELCLTHSAVSQQLRQLENQLGVALFQRSARGLTLTESGRMYRERVADDLQRLESHTLELMACRAGETSLLIGCVPVFAERWLVPRLGGWLARHPDISVQVRVFPTGLQSMEPAYDAAIQYQDAVWPGASAEPLMAEECVAVCAPAAPFRARLKRGDFRQVPLLHLNTRPQGWQQWFAQAGIALAPANSLAGHRFDLFSMIVEAARGGAGAALVPRFSVERELARGELELAHRHVLAASQTYSLFVPGHRKDTAAVAALRTWLRAELPYSPR
jgi:DNA-binding transcriptional LysR family regulator